MMNFESRIHAMLDEIIGKGSSESHYSIIEKYFKKIREDIKKDCIEVVDKEWRESDYCRAADVLENVTEEIKKL